MRSASALVFSCLAATVLLALPSDAGVRPVAASTPGGPAARAAAAAAPKLAPTATPSASPAAPAAVPVRLSVPALGVDAVTEAVGVDDQARVAAPSQADHVGWYRLGPAPGDAGDAIIDGHLDWWTGPAVFARLSRLHDGDEVFVVRSDGSQLRFVVDGSGSYPYDSRPPGLFTNVGPPSLSLITCAGTWDRQRQTYLSRLIVHATFVPPPPSQPPPDGV